MVLIFRFIIIFIITMYSAACLHAADFKISLISDSDHVEYDFTKHYLNLKLMSLVVPENSPPQWYQQVFLKRKDYGIAYFEYTFEDGSGIKKILFEYEKTDKKQYRYHYLVPTAQAPAYLLEKALITRPFNMQLVVKNWESGENTSLLKTFVKKLSLFTAATPALTSTTLASALQIGTASFDAIEEIFPAASTEESGTITIDPGNLRKLYHLRMQDSQGKTNEFATLSVTTSDSLFTETHGHLDATLTKYPEKFKGVKGWKDIIQSVDQDIEKGDINPVINTLTTLNKHITTLSLTNTDKIILLAKAACRWAPLTMNKEHISIHKFAEIAVEGAEEVLDRYGELLLDGCRFATGDCYLPITCSAFAFYSKSSSSKLKQIAKQYIDSSFELSHINGMSTEVTVEDYLNYFKMRGRSKWSDSGNQSNKTYTFYHPSVNISYTKNDQFSGQVISINFYEDQGNYYLAEIMVK